jgi:hypothetical protein
MANQPAGKAPSDSPALKPYRGKPALRNFRGGNGNVGIIRSPVRAIALPDITINAVTAEDHELAAVAAAIATRELAWRGSVDANPLREQHRSYRSG